MKVSIRKFPSSVYFGSALLVFALAQSAAQTVDRREARSFLEEVVGKTITPPSLVLPVLEGPIDPKKYIVGPSDMLSISVWGPVNFSVTIPVTPEGDLIIPTVGVLSVRGKTLEEVKGIVRKATNAKYSAGDVTTTLVGTRSFIVTVTGNIMNSGQYQVSSVDRVEKVVIQASRVFLPAATVTVQAAPGKEEKSIQQSLYNDPRLNQVAEIFGTISTRNILVFRGGDTLNVDIPKFYATKKDEYNPFLLDGDVIFVPRKQEDKNFIGVYGAVNAPGKYEFVNGDSLSDALLIAGGPTPNADLSNIKAVRMDERGKIVREYRLDASKGFGGANLRLEDGDRVVVGGITDLKRDFKVNLEGEVTFPGYYPISSGETRLSSVIRDAGGFTETALLSGAVILRKTDNLDRIAGPDIESARNLRAHRLSPADSIYFFLDLGRGRHPVVVDFAALFEKGDSSHDVIVRDDDIIYVPSNYKTVLVNGQVANPGQVPYVAGVDFRYYVKKAGGFSELALESDTRVIKRATLEWVEPAKTSIEPGDQIWVPKEERKEFPYYFGIVRDLISLTASVVTAVYVVIQISK